MGMEDTNTTLSVIKQLAEVLAMRLCVLVLLCISATNGRGVVDILRMAERDDYMSDVEETDEGVACDSCCEVPEDDTCGGILNKLDEIKVVIGNICTGDEPEEDDEWIEECKVVAEEGISECMTEDEDKAMVECVQEITGVLVEDPAETLQVCKCQKLAANRKILEDASELLCSDDRDARNTVVHDDVLLWWIYIQGYYRHAWGHRNFGFNPHQKPKQRGTVGIFNTANAPGRATFQVGLTNRADRPSH